MDHLWCLVPVCRLRPWPGPGVRLRLLGPVESGPDGAGGVVGVAAPRVGDGADDVQAVVPGWAGHGLVPGAVGVLDLGPGGVGWADGRVDGSVAVVPRPVRVTLRICCPAPPSAARRRGPAGPGPGAGRRRPHRPARPPAWSWIVFRT